MAGPFSFEGKTINAANNHDGTKVGGDIVTSNSTMKGNSADYLTARLKSVSDAIELARANKDKESVVEKIPQQTPSKARDHKDDRELHGLLVKHRPSPSGEKGGRPKAETVNNVNGLPKRAMGNTRAYIEQRLQAESIPPSYTPSGISAHYCFHSGIDLSYQGVLSIPGRLYRDLSFLRPI